MRVVVLLLLELVSGQPSTKNAAPSPFQRALDRSACRVEERRTNKHAEAVTGRIWMGMGKQEEGVEGMWAV